MLQRKKINGETKEVAFEEEKINGGMKTMHEMEKTTSIDDAKKIITKGEQVNFKKEKRMECYISEVNQYDSQRNQENLWIETGGKPKIVVLVTQFQGPIIELQSTHLQFSTT